IKNYGKIAFRNFQKNANYALINVLSMSIGLACCIVSYLNYNHNHSFDHQHRNYSNIYRINYQEQELQRTRQYGIVPEAVFSRAENLSSVRQATQYLEWGGNAKKGNEYFDMNVAYVTDNFFEVFDFPLLTGSYTGLVKDNGIIVTQELAVKIFGHYDILGKTLNFVHQGQERLMSVSGVLSEMPTNSSIQVDAFTSMANFSSSTRAWDKTVTAFLLLGEGARVGSMESILNDFARTNDPDVVQRDNKTYYLDPLKGMALRAQQDDVIGPMEVALPLAMDLVPIIISGLILLLASFTFTNTTIASAAGRLKEIGVRKVMGGRKDQIVIQFLWESLFICVLAGAAALPLSAWLADQYNQLLPFLELELVLEDHLSFFIFLIAVLLLTGLIAGGYPALFLSKFHPAKILKRSLKYRSIGRWTKILLSIQFAFAMITIIASFLFVRNAGFMGDMDLGFDTESTIVVRFGNQEGAFSALHNALVENPRIEKVTGSVDHVGRRFHSARVRHGSEEFPIVGLDVGPDYLAVAGLTLTSGRDLDPNRASDYLESVLVNKKMVASLGGDDPLGKKLTYQDSIDYYVVGVVEDFYFDAFNSDIQPLWIRLRPEDEFNYLIAKTSPDRTASVMEEVKMTWRGLFNTELEDIKPPEYAREEATIINSIIMKVLTFMGSIAAIMALVGFYSLVSLNLFNKTKEIGVRRVLGSSIGSVIKEVNRDYWLILLFGIISGTMISHFAIPILMSSLWAEHIQSSLWVSTSIIMLILGVCFLTVATKVIKAAGTNPVHLLKDE
ncbi:MAG: ABC transporter permease, partial [Bacteroidota bacterium]